MLVSTKFIPGRSFPTIFQYIRIRDRIVIDKALKAKLEVVGANYNVVLLAREIEHAPGIDLVIPGGTVKIVATRYDARGGSIDVSGAEGAKGEPGRIGARGFVAHPKTSVPGGPGGPGHIGATGGDQSELGECRWAQTADHIPEPCRDIERLIPCFREVRRQVSRE